jgi:peptide/nickel transport system permease protein
MPLGTIAAVKRRTLKAYVEALRLTGASHMYVACCSILPNYPSTVIVQAPIALAVELLIITSLSYLGMDAPAPTPIRG